MTFRVVSGILRSLDNRFGLSSYLNRIEDWWFDSTRSVQTRGKERTLSAARVVGEIRDSLPYIPIRIANGRRALRDLPLEDHSQYTFIDIGSGKGRMLFIAAEFPFHQIRGVEFVSDLHAQAQENVRRYRYFRQKCTDIASIHENAESFDFPSQNLVLCIFNPFGPEVLDRMLKNLRHAIDKDPRHHVIILLIWPVQSQLVAQMEGIAIYKKTRRHHIYQIGKPPRSEPR
jgi:SAM-dependent methyltransferase